jgi:hypothetical protein
MLAGMYDSQEAIRVQDILEMVPAIRSEQTAYSALDRLIALGLVEKRAVSGNEVEYVLTWPGRMVGRALCEMHNEEPPTPELPGGNSAAEMEQALEKYGSLFWTEDNLPKFEDSGWDLSKAGGNLTLEIVRTPGSDRSAPRPALASK